MHRIGSIGSVLLAGGLVILTMHRPRPESPPPCPPDLNRPAATSNQDSGPTIGFLDTRDHRITLHGSGLYTIATKDGRVLAEKVTLKQVQASNPQLHGILQRAVAKGRNNDARGLPQRGWSRSDPAWLPAPADGIR